MKANIIVKCPHCKFDNRINKDFDKRFPDSEVMACDEEDGGCDERFVVDYDIRIKAEALKIQEPES